jgi:hypothetical protein
MTVKMARSRVFVSSVIEGFAEYRQAARSGIEQAGGDAVHVNEDFSAQASSSRNTCLDAIDSCDVFLLILGARGGWKTPSGRLVVEEEFEHALARKLPVLVFLEDVPRDTDGQRLAQRLSDLCGRHFPREVQRRSRTPGPGRALGARHSGYTK